MLIKLVYFQILISPEHGATFQLTDFTYYLIEGKET